MDLFSRATSRKHNASKANSSKKSMKASTKIPSLTPKAGSYVKAPSYTPSPGAKQLGLHASRPNTATPSEPKARPLTLDKPLPSPPVAQIVNPSSPPKVSRTLMDATVAGTPTEEQYPVLRPENVEVHELPAEPLESEQKQAPQSSQHLRPELMHIAQDDSPLARRHTRRRAMISPGSGLQFETHTPAVSPAPVEPPSTCGSGATQLGETSKGELDMNFRFPATPTRQPKRRYVRTIMTRDIDVETASSVSEQEGVPQTSSIEHLATVRSLSRSPMTESAEDRDAESGTRMKRLSSHSQASTSGLGMVLTIAEDADMIILGQQRRTPEVPPLPDVVPNPEEPQPRSLSALAGRLSRKKGHSSLFAQSRPRTSPSPSPVVQNGPQVEDVPKQMGTIPTMEASPDNFKTFRDISERCQVNDPVNHKTEQIEHDRLASNPPPVPPKDSARRASKIPAPQPLAERPTHTAPHIEPNRPTTSKSFSTAGRSSATNTTRSTPSAKPQVRLKKSFRKLFHRDDKDGRKGAAKPGPVESKRSSPVIMNSSRVPSSSTVSKVEVPKKTGSRIIGTLLARAQQLPEHSAERHHAVEIVEAMVSCIDHSKEAKSAASQAEKFAKKAEAHANAAQASLQKFVELAGSGLDSEVIGGFVELFRSAGLASPSIQ